MNIKHIVSDFTSLLRIIGAKITGNYFPFSVTLIITCKCNYRCQYCDVFNDDEKEMTTGEIISVIDDLAELGTRRLSLNGGEALLREDLGTVISHAKNRGMFVTLFTNGSLISRNIENLKGLDVILISLDGPREIHDAQRIPGSFDQVMEGIESAKEAGLTVWTNTVITKHNLDSLDFILDTARKLKIHTCWQPVFNYIHSPGGQRIEALLFDEQKYGTVINRLISEKKAGGPIVHSIDYLRYIRNPDWNQNNRTCWAGKFYFAITPSGRAAPCYPIYREENWPNCIELGCEEAFKRIGDFSCGGCYCLTVENDFIFDLRLKNMVNSWKKIRT